MVKSTRYVENIHTFLDLVVKFRKACAVTELEIYIIDAPRRWTQTTSFFTM